MLQIEGLGPQASQSSTFLLATLAMPIDSAYSRKTTWALFVLAGFPIQLIVCDQMGSYSLPIGWTGTVQ